MHLDSREHAFFQCIYVQYWWQLLDLPTPTEVFALGDLLDFILTANGIKAVALASAIQEIRTAYRFRLDELSPADDILIMNAYVTSQLSRTPTNFRYIQFRATWVVH
jgi:hypothetical protein